jgi:retron-type reverse transcriptase
MIDKILLIVLKDLLEPEMENLFQNQTFPFRPSKSIQQALIEVKNMKHITWVIKGDIKVQFDKNNYHILTKILKDIFKLDQTILNII